MTILAVGCHPDDLEISCGGTLARAAAEGHKVVMCRVANGDKGSVDIPPPELRAIRKAEAEKAAAMIGAEAVGLDVPDLTVRASEELVRQLATVIRRVMPDLIITHNPEDYMCDHEETSRAVFDAAFSATVPHYGAGEGVAPLCPIYYMEPNAGAGFLPAEYVDITGQIETKLTMLACHESQLRWLGDHAALDVMTTVREHAGFRGNQCGVRYAEAFRPCMAFGRMRPFRVLP